MNPLPQPSRPAFRIGLPNRVQRGTNSWLRAGQQRAERAPYDGTTVKTQFASVQYSSEVDPDNKAISSSVLNVSEVSVVKKVWGGCWRAKRRYKCGGCYGCLQGCFKTNGLLCGQDCSIGLTGPKKFKLCQYTGNPWDYCVLVSAAVCTATGYDCNNCQGNKLCKVNYQWFSWTCWQGAC